ncbi:MAG: hypothetical protein C5B56_11945 [Proteobacteria bacterium]|nr:MAG: hypothetical protein C5B56_11945 [Pseudomonadota bacterium]
MSEMNATIPRLSIVMPNFNHGHTIGEALSAIAQQSKLPSEVVVVDDGSTDESMPRLLAISSANPWLAVHRHPENRGVNAAVNTGLNLVRGEFVLMSAADDCLSREMVERAADAAAAFPHTGIIFSDPAEMNFDGTARRISPLDLGSEPRYFSGAEFVRLLQRSFFYFHVSNVWFNTDLLRTMGGFPPDVKWHGDLLAAYAAAFERGAVYVPGAVSFCRIAPETYGSAGKRSGAQQDVLRAWLAVTRQPGWEHRRAALVAAAIWPDHSLTGLRVLMEEDRKYISLRLVGRIAWYAAWNRVGPLAGQALRGWLRSIRTRLRHRRMQRI